jgi:hypothetical protein
MPFDWNNRNPWAMRLPPSDTQRETERNLQILREMKRRQEEAEAAAAAARPAPPPMTRGGTHDPAASRAGMARIFRGLSPYEDTPIDAETGTWSITPERTPALATNVAALAPPITDVEPRTAAELQTQAAARPSSLWESIKPFIPIETQTQFADLPDLWNRYGPGLASMLTPGYEASGRFINSSEQAANAFRQGQMREGVGYTGLALQNLTQAGLELASLGVGTAATGPLREGMTVAAQKVNLPPPTSWPEAANIAGWENAIAYKPQFHEAYMRLSRTGEPLSQIAFDSNLGPVFQASGNFADTLHTLLNGRTGVVQNALFHPQIGFIDLPWGFHGYGRSDGWGLSKLVQFHPEAVDQLPDILLNAKIDPNSTSASMTLLSNQYRAAVNSELFGEPRYWLNTAYKRDPNWPR